MSASADPCASPPLGTLWCHVTTAVAVAAAITFSASGTEPNSDWLSGFVNLDPKGLVLTGDSAAAELQLLETSRRGVFAIGDVRSGSVKRVGAAIGEGARVVAALHSFLADASVPSPVSHRRRPGE